MKRHFPRIASLSALAVAVMLGGAGRAAAQNNSLYAAEQQRAAMAPAETSRAATTPGRYLAGFHALAETLAGP